MTDHAKPAGRLPGIVRRTFLIGGGLIGGGLLVGSGVVAFQLAKIGKYRLPSDEGESFGAFLRIGKDGIIDVAVPHQDMGQGIYALATLLAADGLRVSPDRVRAIPAPTNARFANILMLLDGLPMDPHEPFGAARQATEWTLGKLLSAMGMMGTGGSTSTRNIAGPIRQCAASAFDMLMRAAAQRFAVAPAQLTVADGRISGGGKTATYAELAAEAARLDPREVDPGPLGQTGLIGKGIPRPDVPAKVHGQAMYGIDARQPGQLYAAIRHSPRLGGKVSRAALKGRDPGVQGIVTGEDWVAVVADGFAQALAALDKAEIVWDDQAALSLSTADVVSAYSRALDSGAAHKPRFVIDAAGDISAPTKDSVKSRYFVPFLAHAAMEPINATALVTDKGCEIWAGHQSSSLVAIIASRAAGCETDAVKLNTPWLGGGFGRRADLAYIGKAVEIAKHFKGKPVQTIWTRAEDMRDDVFRPAAMAEIEATLGPAGVPSSFTYRVAGPSVTDQFVHRILPMAKGGLMPDRTSTDGASFPIYGLPNRSIESLLVDTGVPVGFWRSVGYSVNAFFFESFIDELAHKAGQSPIEFRRRLLAANAGREEAHRATILLQRLEQFDKANPLPPAQAGRMTGRGLSLTESFKSFVGQFADVEVDQSGGIRVSRVFAVVDCGFAIDPGNVKAQIRSAINYGLSAALFGKVDLDNGKIVQTNFDSYQVLTLADSPRIDVEIVNSGAAIGGVGEVGTPGIAPAVGNALFAATGKRLRALPFDLASGA
jgi:isoquinoline 1-oxidoreductase beta subunit